MLITACALGAAIAGLVLYYQKKNKPGNRVTDAGKIGYQTMNNGLVKLERPAHHAMG